ncbi:MAG TPA: exodeoxyribonuclease VII small subunit [Steroidobacteraceae bacterium]|nr:exodeoxyribonuclease VII small subunit [Steroidobacteraceae bacterium]
MTRKNRDEPATPDFETSLQELETLVAQLERGDLPLAESLALFEQGVALTRSCHARLTEAQQKVSILLQQNGAPQDFDPDIDNRDE